MTSAQYGLIIRVFSRSIEQFAAALMNRRELPKRKKSDVIRYINFAASGRQEAQ